MRPHALPGPVCEVEPGPTDPPAGFVWVILPRNGRRPIAVQARLILRADNRCVGVAYHSALSIYETAKGHFGATVCHNGPSQGGPPFIDTLFAATPLALRQSLVDHDAGSAIGFSLGLDNGDAAVAAHCFHTIWRGLLGAVLGCHAGQEPRA